MVSSLKTGAYYLSQYSWILYALIPLIYSLIFPEKTEFISIISPTYKQFDVTLDPRVFAHITDTHISIHNDQTVSVFRDIIRTAKNYSPEFIVLTGDIVDNYDTASYPRYGDQIEENWKIYQKEISNLSIPIIDIGGNHDMFGIKTCLSGRNFLLDYSYAFNRTNVKSEDDFTLHSFNISGINVIAINPFDFPTPHPPLLFFKTTSQKLLNRLEDELLAHPKSIVISHYPTSMLHSSLSSSSKKFNDIIGSKDVVGYLTGHTHPQNPDILHHGVGGIEIVGPAAYEWQKFGIVTLDNDNLVWSTVNLNSPPKGVITYPVPKSQISANTIFHANQSEIRVIMFTDRKDLDISITGFTSGKMKYSRSLKNGASLYTFPLNVSEGVYSIRFSGDFESSLDFVVGTVFNTGGEVEPALIKSRQFLYITLPIVWLIFVIITFNFPANCYSMFEGIENWIEGTDADSSAHYGFSIFLGFLLIRTRYQRLPKLIRTIIFIAVISPILVPSMFFETEGAVGLITIYGYYISGSHHSADYGTFYAYFYLILVCFPMIILCSSFGVKNWSKKQCGDIVLAVICIAADIFVVLRLVYESVGPKLTVVSPAFVIIPLLFIVILIVWRIKEGRKLGHKMQYDLTDSSLSTRLTTTPAFVIQ